MQAKSGFFWVFLFCLWFVVILFLALQTANPTPESKLLAWDKFQHAAAFGLLALFGGKALENWLSAAKAWLMAFMLVVLLGGLVEVAQAGLTTYRSGDWYDLLADTVGAALVSATALLVHSFSRR